MREQEKCGVVRGRLENGLWLALDWSAVGQSMLVTGVRSGARCRYHAGGLEKGAVEHLPLVVSMLQLMVMFR